MGPCLRLYLAVLCVLLGNLTYISLIQPVSTAVNYNAKQIEVTTGGKLLNSQGQLIDRGFARLPIKDLNEDDIIPFLGLKQLSFLRYKKWDFFDVITNKFQLMLHVADLGYAGNVQLTLYTYATNELITISDVVNNVSKLPKLNPNSARFQGSYAYESDIVKIKVNQIRNESGHSVELEFSCLQFSGQAVLHKKLADEELVMLTPINQDGSHFYYNTKTYGMKASGKIFINNQQTVFNESQALGGRDIGRGVWNYNSFWFWGHGQGFVNNQKGKPTIPFGIDLGNGFEHESTETYEDCIILNGRLNKLQAVRRTINEDDVETKWTLKTDKQGVPGSLNATFTPALRGEKSENFLVIQASFKQFFGVYEGTFIDEKGRQLSFKNIYGFAELHRAKW